MAQQTALTWFWEQIPELLPFTVDTETAVGLLMAYEEAKAMEKKNIIDAWEDGSETAYHHHVNGEFRKCSHDYYYETYQSNQDKPDN